MKLLTLLIKGLRIVLGRLRTQGFKTTLLWVYARGIPALTGIPILRYSRITPQILVGPQYQRAGKRLLESQGIRHAVNLRIEFDDAIHGLALANYCYLPTIDDDAPTLEHLKQGVAFVEQAVVEGGQVYIHCAGGVGRAPTMAAAYFIGQGIGLEKALGLIRQARPFIKPTAVQMEQLRRFEQAQSSRG